MGCGVEWRAFFVDLVAFNFVQNLVETWSNKALEWPGSGGKSTDFGKQEALSEANDET
jgi:hypothetical protein